MKRSLIMAASALLLWSGATAQSNSYEFGGLVFSNDAMSTGDIFSLSQAQTNFGTARSMGMAGAFTSLGADQSSMSINPAGLGMYRHGEVAVTPMMTFSRSSTPGAMSYESNSKNRFGLGNIGAVFNVYEGTGKLLSLNIGVGYNRKADYNYSYSLQYRGSNLTSSIADALSLQLDAGGVSVNQGKITLGGATDWNIDPFFWNGVAAYKSFLVDYDQQGYWYPSEIGNNAVVDGGATVRSVGSSGEFNIAMGANLNNKLYLGFSIGIQTLYQRKDYYYGEAYSYDGGNGYGYGFGTGTPAVDANGNQLPSVMQSMGMTQTTKVSGSGVDFKVGLTYRPIPALRLAVAFHTPTYYSLDRKYQTAMATASLAPTSTEAGAEDFRPHEYTSEQFSDLLEDTANNAWSFVTPSRLLFGASYTFGSLAIISVDYERDWYNGIRVKGMPYLPYGQNEQDFKQDFKYYFKGSNTLRIGAEIRPIPLLALRAGFGYNGSMLHDKNTIFSSPAVYQTTYYTAGLGFSLGRTFIDLAYCYSTDKLTPYMLFYGNRYTEMNNASVLEESYKSEIYSTQINRHNVALTLGFRF